MSIANQASIAIEACQYMGEAGIAEKQAQGWTNLASNIQEYSLRSWNGAAKQACIANEVEMCSIYLIDAEENDLRLREFFCIDQDTEGNTSEMVRATPPPVVSMMDSALGYAASNIKSGYCLIDETGNLVSGDREFHSRINIEQDFPPTLTPQSLMVVPLIGDDGAPLGVVSFLNKQDTLEDTQQVEGFSDSDLNLAIAMAQVLAQAEVLSAVAEGKKASVKKAASYRDVVGVIQGQSQKSADQLMEISVSLLNA